MVLCLRSLGLSGKAREPCSLRETLTGSLLWGSNHGQLRGPRSRMLLSLQCSGCSEEAVANLRAPLCFCLLNITACFLHAAAWLVVLSSSGLAAGP